MLRYFADGQYKMKRKNHFLHAFLGCLLSLALVPAMAAAPGDILYDREDKTDITAFPPTVFPHWLHRIHYRCDVCHDSMFEMKKGATPVTMDMIDKGEACGICHNGEIAFDSDFSNCVRCHVPPAD